MRHISIDKSVLRVLKKLQQIAPTYLSGGYLRDQLIQIPSNDVDILTEMPIEKVKEAFPQLQSTDSGFAFGVGRFSYAGIAFEITSYHNNSLDEVIRTKDFTINSMYHDGTFLYDPFDGKEDISKKTIRPLEDPYIHTKRNPQAYLRAIRLSSQLGFTVNHNLLLFLKDQQHIFNENNESRIQQEGYRILLSAYPLQAWYLLNELNFITINQDIPFDFFKTLPVLEKQMDIKLALIANDVGIEPVHQFIDLFKLSKQWKAQINRLLPYLDDAIPDRPILLNKIIQLKRYQYKDEPDKMECFMNKIRNSN